MVTANEIIEKVADLYGITVDDITSRKRYRLLCEARAVACYVLCSLNNSTFIEVGRLLNRRHGTVMHHNHRAGDWVRNPRLNPRGAMAIREIEEEYINEFNTDRRVRN